MTKRKRVHPKRRNGLFNPEAPFWRGDRADGIMKARLKQYKRKRKRSRKRK